MKELSNQTITNQENSIGDIYDIVKEVLKVHTKETPLNEDYTLSNLRKETKEQKFIRNRIRTAEVCYNFMTVYNEDGTINEDSKEFAKKLSRLMMSDCISLVNLSRSNDGAVLTSVLGAVEQKQEIIQEVQEKEQNENKGIIGKLKRKVK